MGLAFGIAGTFFLLLGMLVDDTFVLIIGMLLLVLAPMVDAVHLSVVAAFWLGVFVMWFVMYARAKGWY